MALLLLVPLVLLLVALLASVLRVLFAVGVALAAALATGLVLPPGDGQGWIPLAVFVAVLVLLSMRNGRSPRPLPRVAPAAIPSRIPDTRARPGAAWAELRRLADWRTRRRLDEAWDACARYLTQADTNESESAQLPIKVGRHAPAMIADCARLCRTATRDERRALLDDLLSALEPLAARAEERRRELAHAAQDQFRTLRTHLARPED